MVSVPFVTVILAVRNEAPYIAKCLQAALEQDYPPDRMEILLADGASTDETLEIVRALPGASVVQIVHNPKRIQSAGLNALIKQSRGDVIIRVDGHTTIEKDYVRQCVNVLHKTGASAVGGQMRPVGITPMGKAIAVATCSRFAVPSAFHVDGTAQYTDTIYMGAWPRAVLERVGGFDEQLRTNEDYELHVRIRRLGGRIYLSPTIRSWYFGRQTLRSLARQYYHYGRGKSDTLRKHPGSLRPRQVVAPAFVGFLLAGIPLFLWPHFFAVWALILSIYVGLNLCYSISASKQLGLTQAWRVGLAFLTIHLAWGSGFWVGWLSRGAVSTVNRERLPASPQSIEAHMTIVEVADGTSSRS